MVFQKKEINQEIFDSYIEHLSRGAPASGWSFLNKRDSLKVTASNISSVIKPPVYDDDMIRVAKARGVESRRKALLDLLEDPKTAIPKLAVLKAIHEIFFADSIEERTEESFLIDTVNDIIKLTNKA